MEVLSTYIYELKKGSKSCALMTFEYEKLKDAILKIKNAGFSCFFQKIDGQTSKVNLFFGEKIPILVLKNIIKSPLNELTSEQDFVLGILLGYDIKKQCERFLKRHLKGWFIEFLALKNIKNMLYLRYVWIWFWIRWFSSGSHWPY